MLKYTGGGGESCFFLLKWECRLNICATLVRFAIQLHLVGLHHFLNGFPDITQTHINSGVLGEDKKKKSNVDFVSSKDPKHSLRVAYFDASVGGVSDGFQ